MSLGKTAFRNFFINYGTRIVDFGFTFAINIIVVRGLGPESFGLYTTVFAIAGVFALVSNLGFEEILNTYIPRYRDFRSRAAYLFSTVLSARIIILSAGSFALYFLAGPISELIDTPVVAYYLRISLPFLFIGNITTVFTFLYTGLFRFGTLAAGKAILLVLQLAGVILIFEFGYGIDALIYLLVIINAVLLIFYFILGYKYISFKRTDGVVLKKLFLFGLTVWLINLATFGLGKQSDIILMGVFKIGNDQVGYYQTAFGLCNTLNTLGLGGLFGLSLSVYASASNDSIEKLARMWNVVLKFSTAIMAPGLLFTIVFADSILVGLYGVEYRPGVILYQIFASFMLFARYLGGRSHTIALYALDKQNTVFIIRLILGVFNISVNAFLIPKWGAMGALIGTGFSALLTSLVELIVVSRLIGASYPFSYMAKILISSLIAIVPFSILFPRQLWVVTVCGILFYGIVVIILWLLKPLDRNDVDSLAGVNVFAGKVAAKFEKRRAI